MQRTLPGTEAVIIPGDVWLGRGGREGVRKKMTKVQVKKGGGYKVKLVGEEPKKGAAEKAGRVTGDNHWGGGDCSVLFTTSYQSTQIQVIVWSLLREH